MGGIEDDSEAEKHPPAVKRELSFDAHGRSSGDRGEQVLAALASLGSKNDALAINAATKNDVATLKAEMVASTQTAIAEAVGPLEIRLAALEAHPLRASTSTNSPKLSRVMERLNKLDPALKSIMAIGFDAMGLQDRTRTLRKFMNEHFKDIKFTTVDTIMKGRTYNDRKATKIS